jgi:hypothetical protein
MARLTDAEQAMLDDLAAPIDGARGPEFRASVERAIEAAAPAAVGPGLVWRAGAAAQRDFRDVPADLRQNRIDRGARATPRACWPKPRSGLKLD